MRCARARVCLPPRAISWRIALMAAAPCRTFAAYCLRCAALLHNSAAASLKRCSSSSTPIMSSKLVLSMACLPDDGASCAGSLYARVGLAHACRFMPRVAAGRPRAQRRAAAVAQSRVGVAHVGPSLESSGPETATAPARASLPADLKDRGGRRKGDVQGRYLERYPAALSRSGSCTQAAPLESEATEGVFTCGNACRC